MKNRRWLSLLLVMTMLFICIPGGIFAEGEDEVVEIPVVLEEPVAVEAAVEVPVVVEEPAAVEIPEEVSEPVVEEPVVIEEAPTVEETPAVEEAPAEEEAPVAEEAPAVEETPVEDEASDAEEEIPAVEETPVAEEVSAAEQPAVEEIPEQAAAPVTEPEVETETAPAAEEPAEPVEDPAAEPVVFVPGLAKLSAGAVFADAELKETAGTVNAEAIVFAVERIAGEGELTADDVIGITANVGGECKTLYVNNGRLTYLNEEETAAYQNEKHDDGVDFRYVKLDAADFTAAVEEAAEEEPAEEVTEEAEPVAEAAEETVPVEVVVEETAEETAPAETATEEPAPKAEEVQTPDEDAVTEPEVAEEEQNEENETLVSIEIVMPEVEEAVEEAEEAEETVEIEIAEDEAEVEETDEIVEVESADAGSALSIKTQPMSTVVAVGETVTFTLTAQNATGYQWQFSKNGETWTNITAGSSIYSGGLTNTLTYSQTTTRAAQQYRCIVTGASGSATSSIVTAELPIAVVLTAEPESIEVAVGETVTFTLTAQNATGYQWQYSKNGETWTNLTAGSSIYSGALTNTLTYTQTATRAAQQYRCIVTGNAGEVPSAIVTATLPTAVVITTEPESIEVAVGETVTFTLTAQNATGYQWQYSKNGETWTNLTAGSSIYSGALTNTLTYTQTATRAAQQYRCIVTGNAGEVPSAIVTATLPTAVVITAEPESIEVAVGETVTFTLTAQNATGYQWQFSKNGETWTNITSGSSIYSGGKTNTLTYTQTTTRAAQQYRCIVTGNAGEVPSAIVTATLPTAVVITAEPESIEVAVGETVTFTLTAQNATGYQWQFSKNGETWTNITSGSSIYSGGKTNTLTYTQTATRAAQQYRCIVTGNAGEVPSAIVTATLPAIIQNEVEYRLVDGTLTVVGYQGNASVLVIPNKVEGYTVTKIGESAFEGNTVLTSIDLPDSITVIGKKAFKNCVNLSEMK